VNVLEINGELLISHYWEYLPVIFLDSLIKNTVPGEVEYNKSKVLIDWNTDTLHLRKFHPGVEREGKTNPGY
jgi:hypothetical protein